MGGEYDRFAPLFEHTNDAIALVEFDGETPVIEAANPRFRALFAPDGSDVTGRDLDTVVASGERTEEAREVSRQAKRSHVSRRELTRDTADGPRDFLWQLVPVDARDADSVERAFAIYTDITRRKARERSLKALHDATQALVAAETRQEIAEIASRTATDVLDLPVNGVHLYDPRVEGLVPVATSPANQEIIGDSPTFRPGDGLAWAVFESGEPELYPDVREVTGAYNPQTPIRSEMVLPLGEHGVFLISSTEVDDFDETDGTLAKILAANVETTLDRAEREAELERQTDRLEEFAGVVSHDLRNPLSVAKGRLDLARETSESEHLDVVERALDRMETLITNLLTLARERERIGDQEPVELRRLLERCWETVETGESTLTIATERAVLADRSRLQQLLENLIRNAVEHGGDDVSITVGDLEHGFYVEDDGPGIPADERREVFEAGYSTARDGAGFGLSIVREIAEAHGWTLELTSGTCGGARFEFSGVRSA